MKSIWFIALLGSFLLFMDPAFAKDIVDSVQTAQAMFNRIGIASVSIGITVGGILFSLGLGTLGRIVLISGVAGAVCVLGAPAAIGFLGRVFGMSL